MRGEHLSKRILNEGKVVGKELDRIFAAAGTSTSTPEQEFRVRFLIYSWS